MAEQREGMTNAACLKGQNMKGQMVGALLCWGGNVSHS